MRLVIVPRRGGLGLTPTSNVSANHMPGEEWTLGPGQGCAPGYVEQMLPNGNWTCISQADFKQVQSGNFTPLVPIGAAPAGPVTFTPPGGTPTTWTPPAVSPAPVFEMPAPSQSPPPAPSTVSTDRVASMPNVYLQFEAANGGMASPAPTTGPTPGPATDEPSALPGWLLPVGLGLAALFLMRKR